jgi:flagellar FliL protein
MADSRGAAVAAQAKGALGIASGKDAPAPASKAGDKPAAPKKKNPKRLIIASAAVVLLASAGAASYFLLGSKDEPATQASGKQADKDKKAEAAKPFFVEFETFTVNLRDPEKFLQIKLTFQVKNIAAAEALKDMTPVVRSAVITVLGSQDAAELMAKEGKEKLSGEVVAAANKALAGTGMDDAIEAVLITHMLIQ